MLLTKHIAKDAIKQDFKYNTACLVGSYTQQSERISSANMDLYLLAFIDIGTTSETCCKNYQI